VIDTFLSHIYARNPGQQKKIGAFFARVPEARTALGNFLTAYNFLWETPEIGGIAGLAAAYLHVLDEMAYCRVQFTRTGRYPCTSQNAVKEQIYLNSQQMLPHILGLAVSHYLWPAQYQLLEFYKQCVNAQNTSGRFLEVGSGLGIFASILANHITAKATIDIVDISPVSIAFAQKLLLATNGPATQQMRFIESDIACHAAAEPYDFIGMGEVLEHVESPSQILKTLHGLLADDGFLYLSTCANCPAIDHVYLFHTIEDIRSLIHDSGFRILRELIAPSENKPLEYIEKNKLDILYATLLEKA